MSSVLPLLSQTHFTCFFVINLMTSLKNKLLFFGLAISLFCSACGANLYSESLSIALVNEQYTYQLYAEDESWSVFDDALLLFAQTGGVLPDGVSVGSNGLISGVPTEVGNFEFRITAYAIDDEWDVWDDCCEDDEDVTSDREWFTLFVTEASTNEYCPWPNDEQTSGLYFCAGNLVQTSLNADESVDLDITYFIDFNNAKGYAIDTLEFTVFFDPEFFYVESSTLSSQILREAATRAGASLEITIGDDYVTFFVQGQDMDFNRSGRLVDLPIFASQNLAEGDYYFPIIIDQIGSSTNEGSFPTAYEVDGFLTIQPEDSDDA
ncbi:MAG: hypothetical protein ACD_62C00170G0016 [uncultured bacterium]|nr:MAG: hypothetical protein ACD_62C00170G0016 [uncultured bacterium]